MKKRFFACLLAILTCLFCAFTFSSCKKESGTYYRYVNGTYDKSDCIIIGSEATNWKMHENDIWSSLKVSGDELTFYSSLLGALGGVKMRGTLEEEGILVINGIMYCKEGFSPEAKQFVVASKNKGCDKVYYIKGVKDIYTSEILVPNHFTSIACGAFEECQNVRKLTLPVIGDAEHPFLGYLFGAKSSLKNGEYVPRSLQEVVIINGSSIEDGAFRSCDSISKITLPESVKVIENSAFTDCSRLNTINIPRDLHTVGDYAFNGCSKLASIDLGEGIQVVGTRAFADCRNLSSVVIGGGIYTIGVDAFLGCEKLTTVYYGGTESDWNDLAIEDWENAELLAAKRYYYSEAMPMEAGDYWHYVDGVATAW